MISSIIILSLWRIELTYFACRITGELEAIDPVGDLSVDNGINELPIFTRRTLSENNSYNN